MERTSANVQMTFVDKDTFVNGKKVKLLFRGQDSSEIRETEGEGEIISNNSVNFSISNLKEGIRYEITGFKIDELRSNFDSSSNSHALITNRTFVTKTVVSSYEVIQISETSARVIVSIEDIARVKENFKGKIKYHNNNFSNHINDSYIVSINNGRAIFEIDGLEKSGTFTIDGFFISDQINNENNLSKLDEKDILSIPNQKNNKIFTLVSETSTITSISSTSDLNSSIVKLKLGEQDRFTINKNITLKIRKQGSTEEKSATARLSVDNSDNNPVADLAFSNLEAGSIYVLSGIEIDKVPKTAFGQNLTDAEKQIVTTPIISRLLISSLSETSYQVNTIIRDPLSGSNDNRKFDGKKVKITYFADDNQGEKLTSESIINISRIVFNLNDLKKSKSYTIEKIEYDAKSIELSSVLTAFNFLKPDVTEENKKFTVVEKTAQITGLEFLNIGNNSSTVKVKFSKEADEYLNTKAKKIKINYRSSENSNNLTSALSSPIIEGDSVVYTFNLTDLGHGSNVRIISAQTESNDDVSLSFASSISNEDKQFNTIPTVRLIKNYKNDEESSWNIEVRLKDLKETSENKKIKLVYFKETQVNTDLVSEEFEINSNRSIVKIDNLEKFVNYKVKEIKLVSDNPTSEITLDLESTINDNDKVFKVIPKIATITEIKEKVGTTDTVSFKLKFSDEDRNYLSQYNRITINYRRKGEEEVITKSNTIDSSTLESTFNFSVGTDNFLQASYEILSVIFEGDVPNSSEKNTNNPNGVRIVFGDNVNKNDRTFATTTNVASVLAKGSETTAEVLVRVNDNSQTYVGSRLKVVYYREDQEDNEITSNEAEILVSSLQGKSEATVNLINLDKAYTYKIKKVLINNSETPFESNFNEASKVFSTVGKTAKVVSISGNENAISKEAATVTLTFDSMDKYLGGSTFVNPNLPAKSLYLLISSRNTGVIKTSTSATVIYQNDSASVTFNLTELDPGDTYEIISLQERTGTPEDNDITFSFTSNLNQVIKTLPALGNVTKNVNVETKAILNIEVINLNDIVEPGSDKMGILTYKKVGSEEEINTSFTYSNKNSIDVELTNLQKNTSYELVKATIDNIEFNFNRVNDTERNKQFTTNYKTAEVSIVANNDKRETSGAFTLNFGQFDDYLNDNWQVNISYQVTNGIERKINNINPINISNKTATFNIENLSGGQTYHITDITLTKNDEKVIARIQNNDEPNSLINTKASIKEISFISSIESQANVTVDFDNFNLDIINNTELIIEYELVEPIENNNHSGTARANVIVNNNNNNNNNTSVTFNLENLVKGKEYKITAIKKASPLENIRFNTNINDVTNSKRKFISLSTSADVSTISFESIERNSAIAVITFLDEFTKTNQQVSILYRKVGTNETFNSNLVEISQDKTARINLNNLEAGSRYEIIGGTLIPSSASVSISNTLQNAHVNKFYTKPEISSININVSSETNARIEITFADEGRFLNGNEVKLIIEPVEGKTGSRRNGAQRLEVNSTINSSHVAIFNLNNLNKFTEYSLKTISDETNSSVVIPYKNIFEEGQELFSSRNFKTLAQNGRLEYISHQYNGDVSTNSTSAKFNVNNDDVIFAKNKNVSITYIEVDEQNSELGNNIVSPQNARISETGQITFNFTDNANNIKPGTKYKIKEINDLSPASERINFSWDGDIYFETLIEQPKVESITALKSEIPSNANTNELYKYDTSFEIKFIDPKNSIKWNNLSDWNVSISGKARNSDESNSSIDTSKIELSRKNEESVLVVKIKSDDIREIVARELTFVINNLSYSSRLDKSDLVTVNSISETSIGNEIVSSPISQLFIERIQSPVMYSSDSDNTSPIVGFSFRVFDPKRSLRESEESSGYDFKWVWESIYSPYPGVATFEYQDGFGSDAYEAWNKNSDDSVINNGKFITPGITKSQSGFKLKQSYSKYQNGNWTEFKPRNVAIHSKRDSNNRNYVLVSYLGLAKPASDSNSESFNITKMYRKNVRLKENGVFALLKIAVADSNLTGGNNNFDALTGNQAITDVNDGTTILRKDISTTASTYSFPQFDWRYNSVISKDVGVSSQAFNNKTIPRINTNSSWIRNHIAIDSTSYNNDNKELTVHFRNNGEINSNIASYAVFQDDEGNLYFAGDDDGNPKNIVTNNREIKYKINPMSVDSGEHAPLNKELKFIGVWTQLDVNNGAVIPIFSTVVDSANVNITFKITNS
ncbi:hypothetical protein NX772_02710 [Mesomycoplasma molare]|uniref:Uncharacterized protein n=1 Tax=Mesomycoplasma molare TaxID=171288 RepID=A0ABY5TWT7_9BACT|nr:hypothetical protein [Mesomycoplasma molare]UWD33996.1 hypothetical protein NX772_02710 [Mesomycoplasma molare]